MAVTQARQTRATPELEPPQTACNGHAVVLLLQHFRRFMVHLALFTKSQAMNTSKLKDARFLFGLAISACLWGNVLAAPQDTPSADPALPRSIMGETRYRALLSYLRCESPVLRDRFGQAAQPEGLNLIEGSFGRAPSGGRALPVVVWDGVTAQVEVLAGYGFFAVFQHYPAASSSVLLRHFAQAGWDMKVKPLTDRKYPEEAKLFAVYEGSSKDDDLPRTLMLVDASLNTLTEGEGKFPYKKDGVTVVCVYSNPTKVDAQSAEPAKEMTEEDRGLAQKFRGIRGGELRVDALINMPPTALHMPDGRLFNIGIGSFGPGGSKISSYGSSAQGDRLVVPKYLRMMRYAEGSKVTGTRLAPPVYDGELVYETTVPIASRIPDAVLDHVRKYNGSLTLKLRLTLDTVLVGWEVGNGSTYPFKRDKNGSAYVTDEDTLPGGDFREAKIFNGKVVRKGWYIDPKTKQRIETDF